MWLKYHPLEKQHLQCAVQVTRIASGKNKHYGFIGKRRSTLCCPKRPREKEIKKKETSFRRARVVQD